MILEITLIQLKTVLNKNIMWAVASLEKGRHRMTFYTIIKLKLTSFKAFIQYINLGKLGAAQREYNYKFYRCRENVLDFSGQNILKTIQ